MCLDEREALERGRHLDLVRAPNVQRGARAGAGSALHGEGDVLQLLRELDAALCAHDVHEGSAVQPGRTARHALTAVTVGIVAPVCVRLHEVEEEAGAGVPLERQRA